MKIYHQLSDFKKLSNAVVTIGTFDGVHYGHQKIVKRLCELAKSSGGESVILTFFPHPRMIIDPENQDLKLINTIKEKAEILANLGVDHLIITPFTRDFSNLSPTEYIKNILVDTIGTKQIIVGYDHRFGKDRKGGMAELEALSKTYQYNIEEIPEQDINDVAVSSTKIRKALLEGDVALAATYLGYHFAINGPVIKGDKIGRTIGFPTANIFVEETYKLIPSDGIYAVTIEMQEEESEVHSQESEVGSQKSTVQSQKSGVESKGLEVESNSRLRTKDSRLQLYKGMAYIGQRPTINGMTRNIEVNIFDFNREIYGQNIKMNFLKFLRHDVKFTGLETLTQQLHQDKLDTLAFFETYQAL
ncbi:bifunctional riboflavin kinase/FAD synthetase [Pedobacter sp. Hv1]|uniref:bifunctional riboflavin kinase/FAD synthetase n=1 Tax=Pedobacter sp. Hv1 TaxID=1740090 RepID=UPI0006D8D03A|nr:bifunctional riboflavin kinase/FAD synthetase [Pedobacter sp. Hv1]KQC02849.1 riboflavin biosynthesis protein RibF [Pedobacter sp. Hv1]